MIEPVLSGEAFLRDVREARKETDVFHLWWLGQSGYLAQWQGRHLLLDPYLSDSLTKKYAATDKPHVRMSERVVDPAELGFVETVTSSHNHTDHLDRERATAIEHLGNASTTAEKRFEIPASQPSAFHVVEQRIDGVRRLNRFVL